MSRTCVRIDVTGTFTSVNTVSAIKSAFVSMRTCTCKGTFWFVITETIFANVMHFTAFIDIYTGTIIEFIAGIALADITTIGVNAFTVTTWLIFTFVNVDAVSLVIRKSESFVAVALE